MLVGCQDYGLDEVLGNLVESTWDEFENSETVKRIREEGADLCDYCEEGVTYTDDATWQQWRRPGQLS